jgi:hypothetical protein
VESNEDKGSLIEKGFKFISGRLKYLIVQNPNMDINNVETKIRKEHNHLITRHEEKHGKGAMMWYPQRISRTKEFPRKVWMRKRMPNCMGS